MARGLEDIPRAVILVPQLDTTLGTPTSFPLYRVPKDDPRLQRLDKPPEKGPPSNPKEFPQKGPTP